MADASDPAVPADSRWPLASIAPSGWAVASDDQEVAYYELGAAGPPLLLVHATGFCGPAMAPVAALLAPSFRCIALDSRGHGASPRPADGDFSWAGFGADALAVVDELGLEGAIGIGHSCGAAALLLAEQARPGTFAGLYCYEPIVYPHDTVLEPSLEGNPLSAGALRRRWRFADREEALVNFSAKAPFDTLDPEVLAAYVDNGFEPDPAGGIRLRCRREDEARVYAHGFSHDAYAHLGAVPCPVTLAGGEYTDAIGPDLLARYARRLDKVEVVTLPGLGHFGPLEDPAAVARSFARSLAVGAS